MFGREINTFEDWRISPNELESAELLKLSMMNKRQFEVKVPQTLKTIEKAQEKQKKNQDKRSNVTKTELVDGDKVFVKISKMQGKLEPKYAGPYSINGKTRNNNYWLLTSEGKRLKQSYPLNELKKVDRRIEERIAEVDKVYIIEKIKKHRIRDGVREFFLKWDGYPDKDSSWIPESSFERP
jgi:hypothetical protein